MPLLLVLQALFKSHQYLHSVSLSPHPLACSSPCPTTLLLLRTAQPFHSPTHLRYDSRYFSLTSLGLKVTYTLQPPLANVRLNKCILHICLYVLTQILKIKRILILHKKHLKWHFIFFFFFSVSHAQRPKWSSHPHWNWVLQV